MKTRGQIATLEAAIAVMLIVAIAVVVHGTFFP
jgi:hypothetical protein